MSDTFIQPDAEDLAEAGLVESSEVEEAGEGDQLDQAPLEDRLARDFKARWAALADAPAEEIVATALTEFAERHELRRSILAAFIAQQLGYRRLFRGQDALHTEPLWDLLDAEAYARLDEHGHRALVAVAQSTQPGRPGMAPMAAIATVALWRHSRGAEVRAIVDEILRAHTLPDEADWLYELVVRFDKLDDDPDDLWLSDHQLIDLARTQLAGRFWDTTAFLCGMYFVRHYATVLAGSPAASLTKAADAAAETDPKRCRPWLELVAEATIGGRLNYGWLEKPMRAAIRLNIGSPERQDELRAFHAKRLYDADHDRLADLYAAELKAYASRDAAEREQAERRLMDEVAETSAANPTRARRLLELMVIRRHGGRFGTTSAKLRRALARIADDGPLGPAAQALARLYVQTYDIEPHAVRLVRQTIDRVEWQATEPPGATELDMYLVVSDYERAFEHLTCKFDGVTLDHADKDAASRVKYFVERRLDPSSISKIVRTLFTPIEWLSSGLVEIGAVGRMVDRALGLFEQRISQTDMRAQVVADFKADGAPIEGYDDIAGLSMAQVERLLRQRRTRRLVLGAVAGGLSGGLAPFSWSVVSLADVPVLLGITADICSRFCWYYGFDPREHPELPMEIMAVALGGSRPSAIEPMLLRQNLREYALQKSLVVGAVAHGSVTQLAGRTLNKIVESQMGEQIRRQLVDLARRTVSKNLQRRAVEAAPKKSLPIVGALLGASLNVALIYDVCEAAQAVLTDRFLERKYPDWIRKFDLGELDAAELAGSPPDAD